MLKAGCVVSISEPVPGTMPGSARSFAMSRTKVALVLSLLVLTALVGLLTHTTSAASDGLWYGEYFTNNQVRGEPAHTMHHHSLNFSWRDLSPPGSHITEKFLPGRNHAFEFFSARWTRTLVLPDAQTWRFDVMADDGVRIFVNGIRILDHWYAPPGQPASAEIPLARGRHNVRIEYFQNTGYAFAHIAAYPVPGSNDPPPPPPRTLDIPAARAVAWAPDARTLAIAGDSLYLHHYYENRLVKLPVDLPAAGIQPALAWHPDGRTLVAGFTDGRIIIHSLTDNQTLTLREHTHPVRHIAFSPDGQTMATGGGSNCGSASGPCNHYDTTVRLWNTQTWTIQRQLTHNGGHITALTFTPDGKYVQAGSYDATAGRDLRSSSVLVWHTETGALTKSWRVQAPVSFARDGRMALTGGTQNRVQLLNVWTGEATAVVPDDGYTWTVAASRFNHRIATATYEDVTRHGTRVRNHLTGADVILVPFSGSIAISPGGRYLVTTEDAIDPHQDFAQPQNDRVRVWEISSGKMLAELSGHLADPRAVSADFSPGDHLLAVALPSGTVRIHNLARLINHPDVPPQPRILSFEAAVVQSFPNGDDEIEISWRTANVADLYVRIELGAIGTEHLVLFSEKGSTEGNLTWRYTGSLYASKISLRIHKDSEGWGDVVPPAEHLLRFTCAPHPFPFDLSPETALYFSCPGQEPRRLDAVYQPFEHGFMVRDPVGALSWYRDAGHPHVTFLADREIEHRDGHYLTRFSHWSLPDTWDSSQPVSDPDLVPPPGLFQPEYGIGKVWREFDGLREGIGWATAPPTDYTVTVIRSWRATASCALFSIPDGRVVARCRSGGGYGSSGWMWLE
jgi:WD40 repeat protein